MLYEKKPSKRRQQEDKKLEGKSQMRNVMKLWKGDFREKSLSVHRLHQYPIGYGCAMPDSSPGSKSVLTQQNGSGSAIR